MRTSQLLLPTLKEDPVDTVVISHKLMLRAGMIRQLASGLYTHGYHSAYEFSRKLNRLFAKRWTVQEHKRF